ncbi:trans-sialidase, putative [Trypanosoma cruzi]|nr:trans-sialidase, putative [Trypanosoma cruzi]
MGGDKMQGDGSHQTPEVSMSSGADRETAEGTDGQGEEIHPQDREVMPRRSAAAWEIRRRGITPMPAL